MKYFNITGTCVPEKHYMVDIDERLGIIKAMVDRGDYFCINRSLQYGKTTTLKAATRLLMPDYSVFQISFEGQGDEAFRSPENVAACFFSLLNRKLKFDRSLVVSEGARSIINELNGRESIHLNAFSDAVNELCSTNDRPIVIIIDEVDQAGNFDGFAKFLGCLREMYLERENVPTFQSVILAGVYDVKNLKRSPSTQKELQHNSPWNIAAPFEVDMSLSENGIKKMLDEYEADHSTGMDTSVVARMLRSYTSGYPYLVSRLCMLLDKSGDWSQAGFLEVVRVMLNERNSLFDDMVKRLEQYPEIKNLLERILCHGFSISFNIDNRYIEFAHMFGIVRDRKGFVTVSNRIFETRLFNYFTSEQETQEVLESQATNSNRKIKTIES